MTVAGRVAAVGLLGLAPLLPAADAASADVFLQAQTTATAVHVTVTQQPASSIITASLLDDAVAYAAADYDSGGSSEALAAPAFPGRLVVQGPQLLCSEVFDCPAAPPAYPLLADASYPRRPRDTAAASGRPIGSGPFVVRPLAAGATASAAGNNGTTTGGETSVLSGTPGAVNVGTSSATSTVTEVGSGLHVQVASNLSDISIGEVVHIAAIRARDDITVKPGKRPRDVPTVTVTGVTVAGQPATIDERGVHVAGNNGPSVGQRLERSGVQVRLVGTHPPHTAAGGGRGPNPAPHRHGDVGAQRRNRPRDQRRGAGESRALRPEPTADSSAAVRPGAAAARGQRQRHLPRAGHARRRRRGRRLRPGADVRPRQLRHRRPTRDGRRTGWRAGDRRCSWNARVPRPAARRQRSRRIGPAAAG